MGSPASRLDIPVHLRAWYDLGLEFVLHPQGGQGEAQQEHAVAEQPQSVSRQPQAPVHNKVQQPTDHQRQQQPQQVPQQPAPQCRPTSAPPVGGTPFPPPWNSFKVPANPRVVITYHELGLDLTGQADPKRGQLMRQILGYTKWPPGTPVFWPCTLPCDGGLVPQTQMFWAGAQRFNCPNILCFGFDALQIIYPQVQQGQNVIMLEQTTIHLLPSASELVGRLPHEIQLSVASIASLRV